MRIDGPWPRLICHSYLAGSDSWLTLSVGSRILTYCSQAPKGSIDRIILNPTHFLYNHMYFVLCFWKHESEKRCIIDFLNLPKKSMAQGCFKWQPWLALDLETNTFLLPFDHAFSSCFRLTDASGKLVDLKCLMLAVPQRCVRITLRSPYFEILPAVNLM